VDDEDYEYLHQWTWFLNKDGYAVRYTTNKGKRLTIRMHRMLVEGREVDHRDGNPLNNQRNNLRAVTHQQNIFNNRKHKDGSSQYKGVSKHRGKWRVQIHSINLGSFTEERHAAMCYDLNAKALFGEYARLNFPLAYSSGMSSYELPASPQLPA
jgi:hypothetical protein